MSETLHNSQLSKITFQLRERLDPKKQVVGLSLSKCVLDIMRGSLPEKAVRGIISGTNAKTPEEWKELIEKYKEKYWQENPEMAENIALRLINSGRVIQPRTEGKPPHGIAEGHWLDVNNLKSWIGMQKYDIIFKLKVMLMLGKAGQKSCAKK